MIYACEECGAKGVRLWRHAYDARAKLLLCTLCTIAEQSDSVNKHDYSWPVLEQLGSRTPAIPSVLPRGPDWELAAHLQFHPFAAVPRSGVLWWRTLDVNP